ncbi:hypothetical protein VPH166E361_0031 [Vibrio phage 166E36-1]
MRNKKPAGKPAKDDTKTTPKKFFYQIAPSKLPRNFKDLQAVDGELEELLVQPLRRSHYISLDNSSNYKELLDKYSNCIDKLDRLLSIHVRWDLHSNFINDLVKYKNVNCYLSFSDYEDIEDYVLSTAHMLSVMLEDYYRNTLKRTRIHKEPIRFACLWFARHLHRMVSKNALCVMYSRSKDFYQKCKKEDEDRGLFLEYPNKDFIVNLTDMLSKEGWGVNFTGYKLNVTDDNSMSIFIPKTNLLEHLYTTHKNDFNDRGMLGRSSVIVRDINKNVVEISEFKDEEDFLNKTRDLMDRYREHVNGFSIELDGVEFPYLSFSSIFVNETIEEGGRLFDNGEWTTLPKNKRVKLKIDGESIKTVDLKALHPSLLYREEGIELLENFDPYPELKIKLDKRNINKFKKFYNIKTYDPSRNIAKLAMLIMINSKDEAEAKSAMRMKVFQDWSRGGTCRESEMKYVGFDIKDIDVVFESVKSHNQPIAKHFFSGASLRLMRIDSDIIKTTIGKLIEDNICVLPLHDSVSTAASKIGIAEVRLKESYQEVLGDLINYRVEVE